MYFRFCGRRYVCTWQLGKCDANTAHAQSTSSAAAMGAKSSVEIVLSTFLTAAWERHIQKSVSLINLFCRRLLKVCILETPLWILLMIVKAISIFASVLGIRCSSWLKMPVVKRLFLYIRFCLSESSKYCDRCIMSVRFNLYVSLSAHISQKSYVQISGHFPSAYCCALWLGTPNSLTPFVVV